MRPVVRGWLIAAGAALLLSACGQKGPLYLPDKGGTVVTSTPAQPATPATGAPKPGDKDKDPDQDQQPKP